MRPFNLVEAKAGAQVCTRDGKDARIICFDRETDNGYSIIALVKTSSVKEKLYYYDRKGKFSPDGDSHADLFMKSIPVKRYVVAYPMYGDGDWNIDRNLYSSQEDAMAALWRYTGAVIREIELEY